ncbi:GyrI-like domain-containing protein [Paenibacillus sp. FSL L8-0340]
METDFTDWFPASGNKHVEAPEVEWYSNGDQSSSDYKSEIWIPVIKK